MAAPILLLDVSSSGGYRPTQHAHANFVGISRQKTYLGTSICAMIMRLICQQYPHHCVRCCLTVVLTAIIIKAATCIKAGRSRVAIVEDGIGWFGNARIEAAALLWRSAPSTTRYFIFSRFPQNLYRTEVSVERGFLNFANASHLRLLAGCLPGASHSSKQSTERSWHSSKRPCHLLAWCCATHTHTHTHTTHRPFPRVAAAGCAVTA